jgi:hypothetical protein
MQDDKLSSNKDPVKQGAAFATDRRAEFLKLTLQNLGVGRQNLHDSQFSSNAKLIEFYEGIALSLQSNSVDYSFLETSRHFREAAKLLALSEHTGNEGQKVVGLEALCNLATVQQRQALRTWRLDAPLQIDQESFILLKAARDDYLDVLRNSEVIQERDKQRIQVTARVGLLICLFAVWRSRRSFDDFQSVDDVKRHVQAISDLLRKTVSVLRQKEDSSANHPTQADDSWSNSQILHQIQAALNLIEQAVGGVTDPRP